MYKARTLEEIFSENKYSFNSNHHEIKNWIKAQDKDFSRALSKSHGYNRVVSMFDFDKLSQLEGFTTINNLCVVSGAEDELETHFVDVKEVFATSLENGYDLTEDWGLEGFKNKDILNSFDFVMCNQVLEHVPDPIKSFKNLVMLAKSGAYIWVSIPVINRIHDEPNFYSSGYHPRYLKFLADTAGLETIHIGAWGSLKYKLFAVSRNWPPYRKLKRGLRSSSDFIFPKGMFLDGTKLDNKHLVDTWGLFYKP
jgi:SAM-dependent methyltransferase